MVKVRRFLILVCVLGAATLAAQVAARDTAPGGSLMIASWVDRPESLEQTVELAEEVVVGRVVNIRRAQPLRVRVSNEPGGFDEVPVEVVTIQLSDNPVKGQGRRGENIEVFHTGHSGTPSAARQDEPRGPRPERPEGGVDKNEAPRVAAGAQAPAEVSAVMGDPAYAVGETYMLFVRQGPELNVDGSRMGTRGIVSPEGRWRVTRGNEVVPMSDRAWAQRMRGRPLTELRGQAAEAAERGRGQGQRGGP